LADDDLGQLLAALGVQLADLAHQRGAVGDRGRAREGPGGLVGAADRSAERVVGDLLVLLDRLAGGWVDYRVAAHFRSPRGCWFPSFVLPLQGRFQAESILDRDV